MGRFRVIIATLVAVGMLSVGAVACTPEQQVEVGTGIGQVFTLWLWVIAHGPGSGYID